MQEQTEEVLYRKLPAKVLYLSRTTAEAVTTYPLGRVEFGDVDEALGEAECSDENLGGDYGQFQVNL